MKKTIIKITVFVMVFLISFVVMSRVMNHKNENLTMEMPSASFPVITMIKDGIFYNQLHGYREAMDVAFQRENITVLGKNREVSFVVDTYGMPVFGLYAEVRSTDGKRLIENSPITNMQEENGKISASITLKDLIETDTEYALVIVLETEGEEKIRYYTRIINSETMYITEKLQFILDFHKTLYDKEAAKELIKYLEPNASGDNSTFHKVNIHSSFQQVTWGELGVEEKMEPTVHLIELTEQTASVLLDYVVVTEGEKKDTYYMVEEYYRVRYTSDRMYLLDFERTMTQIPDVEGNMYAEDKILLGIVGDISFVESEDGSNVIFEVANRLCSYNITTNKLSILFSFYDKNNFDSRSFCQNHHIKILDVDEGGNVRFAVYGYMNRGRNEGEVGIQIYFYDSGLNTIEEAVYIPYNRTYTLLNQEMQQLLYMNREDKVYLFLENKVYEIDLQAKTYQAIVTIQQDDSIQVSDNHKILVWQEGNNRFQSNRLRIKNLSSSREHTITVNEGEAIMPLGFMGEDVIYGIARMEDVKKDNIGRVFFPMYKLVISNSNGTVLKEYQEPNVYITKCSITENQITLERIQKTEEGEYRELEEDHIMNNMEVEEKKNKIVTVNIDKYERYVQIQVSKVIDSKNIQILTPKEIVFEDRRKLELEQNQELQRYYVYGPYGVEAIYNAPARAVISAYEISGMVINHNGECIWQKANRTTRNQIMAIKEQSVQEGQSSLAVCLDTILSLEGMVRDTQALLNQGKSAIEILTEALEGYQVLDLSGCPMDSILYYVNQDIPVLATLENGEAVLIVGFNEFNIGIMNPSTGTIEKKGMNDSKEWFQQNGNCFITFLKI